MSWAELDHENESFNSNDFKLFTENWLVLIIVWSSITICLVGISSIIYSGSLEKWKINMMLDNDINEEELPIYELKNTDLIPFNEN